MHMPRLLGLALVVALAGCGSADRDPAAAPSRIAGEPVQPTPVPQGRFEPRNECVELPGAKPFFLALETAVGRRDADLLLRITDARVKLDFGGGGGLQTFRERLADKDGRLWQSLERLTALGCARAANGDMVMPWYFEQDMEGVDPAGSLIVTGKDVPLRQTPAVDAPALESVSWDAVALTDGLDARAPFQKVRTVSGKEGYIASDRLRSPLDYRLRAAPAGDSWRIVSFVAGD